MSDYKDHNEIKETTDETKTQRTRRSRSKGKKRSQKSAEAYAARMEGGEAVIDPKKAKRKNIIKIALCVILAIALIGIIYVAAVIISAPEIQTDNIYSMLSQSSVLYDDEGQNDEKYGDDDPAQYPERGEGHVLCEHLACVVVYAYVLVVHDYLFLDEMYSTLELMISVMKKSTTPSKNSDW